jgi:hypothetical protein
MFRRNVLPLSSGLIGKSITKAVGRPKVHGYGLEKTEFDSWYHYDFFPFAVTTITPQLLYMWNWGSLRVLKLTQRKADFQLHPYHEQSMRAGEFVCRVEWDKAIELRCCETSSWTWLSCFLLLSIERSYDLVRTVSHDCYYPSVAF